VRPRQNVQFQLPLVLMALLDSTLADKSMVLMALGTIRAETGRFLPIDEGISEFNTTPGGRSTNTTTAPTSGTSAPQDGTSAYGHSPFAAVVALVSGARDQLLKLGVLPGLIAVFSTGFAADTIRT